MRTSKDNMQQICLKYGGFSRAGGRNVAEFATMIIAFASLFCVILAGHFLRAGALLAALLCLALPFLVMFTRARWALRTMQAALTMGGVNWVVTAARIAAERRAEGRPWARMAVILGTVAILSAAAAALLNRRSMLEKFPAPPETPEP